MLLCEWRGTRLSLAPTRRTETCMTKISRLDVVPCIQTIGPAVLRVGLDVPLWRDLILFILNFKEKNVFVCLFLFHAIGE